MKPNFIFLRLRTLGFIAAGIPFTLAAGSLPGVGNFQKVNEQVYRGAQPTDEGFASLAKMGIRTVIDLQESGSARSIGEANAVKAAGMEYVSVPMEEMRRPSDESVSRVLALLENNNAGPVFVHCHRGADRTGGVIACYRIEHDHWTNAHALTEARSMGMSWYQLAIQRYVHGFRPIAGAPAMASGTPAVSSAIVP